MKFPNPFLLATIIFSCSLTAQVEITGTVLEYGTQQVLVGAYLTSAQQAGVGTLTDANGQFLFSLAREDTLVCSYLGFESARWPVSELVGHNRIQIQLQPRINTTTEVTVRAKRISAAELASTTLKTMDIYQNPGAKADPLLAVNTLPAATTPDETANVSLRGSSTEATGIYLNNVPIEGAVRLDQSNGVGQFSLFNTANLKNVRVFASNPPVEFSGAAAGAVGLYTATEIAGNTTQFSLNLTGAGVNWRQKLGPYNGLNLWGNYQTHNAFTSVNGTALEAIDYFRNIDLGGHYAHRFATGTELDVFEFFLNESYGYQVRSGGIDAPFVQQKTRSITVANLRWAGKNKTRWELNQGIDFSRASFAIGNILTRPREFNTFTGLIRRRDLPRSKSAFGLQISGRFHSVSGRFPLNDYALEEGDPSGTYAEKNRHWLPEAFMYRQWRIGRRWLMGTGFKLSGKNEEDVWRPTLQLGLRRLLGAKDQLLIGLGQYQRYVDARPRAEASWLRSRQLSLEWQRKGKIWSGQLALYRKWDRYEEESWNILGAEGRIGAKSNGWQGWVSGAVIRSRIDQSGLTYPSAFDHPFLLRAQMRFPLPLKIEGGFNFQWRRGRYYLPLESARFDPTIERYIPSFVAQDAGER
ncbi:MAG: carboxypeptidase-like regulatory domain-containing protein, partial [Bacteroidota bacterium]